MQISALRKRSPGFSLIELLSVVAIVAVTAALIPSFGNSLAGTALNNGATATINLLTVARTEAITRRQLVRFAVATEWPGDPTASYRMISLWASASGEDGSWTQITKWEMLPAGVAIDPDAARYVPRPTGQGAAESIFGKAGATASCTVRSQTVTMQYLEFTPAGAVRTTAGGSGYEVWFALACSQSFAAGGTPANWAQIAASIHTGRLRCNRPGN